MQFQLITRRQILRTDHLRSLRNVAVPPVQDLQGTEGIQLAGGLGQCLLRALQPRVHRLAQGGLLVR